MDIKELDKLAQLCRKRGILKLKTADIELELSEFAPQSTRQTSAKTSAIDDSGEKAWDELSDEEKLFYSSTTGTIQE